MLTCPSLEFERLVPFNLRSRTAYLAMPSRFPLHEDAIQASPAPSGGSLSITFQVHCPAIDHHSRANLSQRMNLAFNISETIINLHRPYYAKALYAEVDDHVRSVYASSFLTVVERCSVRLTDTSLRPGTNSNPDHYCACPGHPSSFPQCQHKAMEPLGETQTSQGTTLNQADHLCSTTFSAQPFVSAPFCYAIPVMSCPPSFWHRSTPQLSFLSPSSSTAAALLDTDQTTIGLPSFVAGPSTRYRPPPRRCQGPTEAARRKHSSGGTIDRTVKT